MDESNRMEGDPMKRFLIFCLCLAFALTAPLPLGAVYAETRGSYTQTALPGAGQSIYDYALVSGTSRVNLRAGPGVNYEVINAVDENTWVGVTGEWGDWCSIYVPKTRQAGYMSANYLKRGDQSPAPVSASGVVSNPKSTQFLNLRAYPSYDAQVLGIFYNGTPFTVLSSSSDGWIQVLVNNQVGYFRKEFVRLSGASGSVYYIQSSNGGKVNLRTAPFLNGSSIIGQYPAGTQVSVLLSSPVQDAYWKVSVNGAAGYMDSRYLAASSGGNPYPVNPGGVYPSPSTPSVRPKALGYATVNNPKATQYLNLRQQPSQSARVIAQYRNGVRFEVLAPGAVWTKVYGTATGNIGYFMTKYLKLSGVSSSPSKSVSNGSSFVNLRSAPSKVNGQVYTRVPSGSTVTVLIPGDEWTKVRYGSTEGYMMTCFLK